MTTSVDALGIRRRLGVKSWGPPLPFGPDGWMYEAVEQASRLIVTCAEHDGDDWVHASVSHPAATPSYELLAHLHRAIWPQGWAYQVFAPPADHINIHPHALHLWGRLDGGRILPNFGELGTI